MWSQELESMILAGLIQPWIFCDALNRMDFKHWYIISSKFGLYIKHWQRHILPENATLICE